LKSAYGFVQYHTVDEGRLAMENLQGIEIKGRRIRKLDLKLRDSVVPLTTKQILRSLELKKSPRRSETAARTEVGDVEAISEIKIATTIGRDATSHPAAATSTHGKRDTAETVGPSSRDVGDAVARALRGTGETIVTRTGGAALAHMGDLDASPNWTCLGGTVPMSPTFRSSCSPTSAVTLQPG